MSTARAETATAARSSADVPVRVRAVAAVEAARVLLTAAGDTAAARCDRLNAVRLYAAAAELAWLQGDARQGPVR
ncbi:MAG: hypothetical protein ACRCYU_13320 [Nocardioides sp.]